MSLIANYDMNLIYEKFYCTYLLCVCGTREITAPILTRSVLAADQKHMNSVATEFDRPPRHQFTLTASRGLTAFPEFSNWKMLHIWRMVVVGEAWQMSGLNDIKSETAPTQRDTRRDWRGTQHKERIEEDGNNDDYTVVMGKNLKRKITRERSSSRSPQGSKSQRTYPLRKVIPTVVAKTVCLEDLKRHQPENWRLQELFSLMKPLLGLGDGSCFLIVFLLPCCVDIWFFRATATSVWNG